MDDKYTTIKEAADLLKVTSRTIYNLIYKGLLTKHKIEGTRRTLIDISELRNLIKT